MKVLETDRLLLREIRESDASLIVHWRADPEVYQYFLLPRPITKEEHLDWYFNRYMKDRNRIDFIVIEKSSGKEKGLLNIKRDLINMRRSEIGYLLDRSVQGKGYAQEGINRLMIFAKNDWKCEEIIFHIHEENRASQILADRLGYKKIGIKDNFMLYHISLKNCMGGGITPYKIYTEKEVA